MRFLVFLWGSGYFGLYDKENDLYARPYMPVLRFTDAHLSVVHCLVVALPLPCGSSTTGLCTTGKSSMRDGMD